MCSITVICNVILHMWIDIVEGIVRVIDNPPMLNSLWTGKQPDPSSSVAPYIIYNIGNSNPVKLMDFIEGYRGCTWENSC